MIDRKRILGLGMAGLIALTACQVALAAEDSAPLKHPNILLILADDMGYGEIGHYGNPYVKTSAIDGLADEGASFDYFYVNPVCSPSRAALLTGRHAQRTGVSGVTRGLETMDSNEVTLAEVFRDAGYITGCFGKWHNGANYPNDPEGQGFDVFLGTKEGIWFDYFDAEMDSSRGPVKTKGYVTDVLTDAALEFVETANKNRKPFFCYIPYNTPHTPALITESYYAKFRDMGLGEETAAVYGMIENLDENIARLLKKIDELGISEDTIVVFLSDNGPASFRINAGLRGKKGRLYEGGIRVPCFIRWPGHIRKTRIATPAAHIDLLPTLVDLAGIDPVEVATARDGRSLSGLLIGDKLQLPHRPLFIFENRPSDPPDETPGCVIFDRWRAVLPFGKKEKRWELYDITADPGQLHDLAEENPFLCEELTRAYYKAAAAVYADQKGKYRGVPVGYSGHPRVNLVANEATLHPKNGDGIAYSYSAGYPKHWITKWTAENSYCEWPLDVITAGDYQVMIFYTLEQESVGVKMSIESDANKLSFSVDEGFDPPMHSVPFLVPGEEKKYADKPWKELIIGRIHLESGMQTLRLRVDKLSGRKAIDLKRIELNLISSD